MRESYRRKTQNLEKKGIDYLLSYFDDQESKNKIKTKFKNISGKTGQYFVPSTLFQKRTSRKNRALIPFQHVQSSNLTYDQLNLFEGGVAVEFTNNDFFHQMNLPEELQSGVFKTLKNKLGSDDNVSAIIVIRSTGDSSSRTQREAFENLKKFVNDRGESIEDVLIRRKPGKKYSGRGNDVWQGYVYYTIRGGHKDVADSHKEFGIPSSEVQLFNPSVEYASSNVSNDITLVLIYFALFSIPLNKRSSQWYDIKKTFLDYFKNRKYEGITLKSFVESHVSINLEPNKLMDPIQAKPIHIEDFTISSREPNSIDISHQQSVNRYDYIWDRELNEILTPARPTNLFWSKHLSNMMQQNFSLEEYVDHQLKIMEKWSEYGWIKENR